ncbi:MAG: cyclic lactone autoinducer peptide [Syntrophomonadaceae bacterium]|nr:cyclic lactone autoinducer peptide [Syntrophomonadaceae bacterium]
MFKPTKLFVLRTMSVFLLLVASAGVKPACLWHWYQPEIPE